MTDRRNFLAQFGATAAALAFDADELMASPAPVALGPWDISWIDKLSTAQYKAVFNVGEIAEGTAMGYAERFMAHFHEAHGTSDAQTRPVLVFRRLGTALGVNDAMWDKYGFGESQKVDDPTTHAPAHKNVYWPASGGATQIEALQARGMISLVCNVALTNLARRVATQFKREPEETAVELRSNLVPGAILVPSGIYALIRAQNAGCAYMPGS